jgi:hypothetical protein
MKPTTPAIASTAPTTGQYGLMNASDMPDASKKGKAQQTSNASASRIPGPRGSSGSRFIVSTLSYPQAARRRPRMKSPTLAATIASRPA